MPLDTTHSENGAWFTRERIMVMVLAAITIFFFYLCYQLVLPFVPALTWAVAIAVVAYPLHEWMRRRLKSKSLGAAITVLLVTIVILGPAVFVVQQVTNDAAANIAKAKEMLAGGKWREIMENNAVLAPVAEWIDREVNVGEQVEKASSDILGGAKKVISGSIYVVTGLLITLFLLFYFFRDHDIILGSLRRSFPLSPRENEKVFRNVRDAIYAIVYGTLMLALLQGALGGLMFWILGVPSPLLWGSVMAILAVLPVLGAAIIWIPAALFLAVQGSPEKAMILVAWGCLAIGLIDNLLYPLVVKNRLRMHTVPVFIAVIGGLVTFGAAGIVLGPVVLAIAVVLADVWRQRMAQSPAVENGADAEKAAEKAAAKIESPPRRRAAK
jgi:predicted PurR-regulated permease PerM